MTSISWWRSWHGAPTDLKWQTIAARAGSKPGVVSAVVWALIDYASQHQERGTVTGFDTETYAIYSGFPENEVLAIIQAMTDKKVIVDGKLANWDKRQPKSEAEIERVTEYRKKKRALQDVTECYEQLQEITQEKDTDTERDTNSNLNREREDFPLSAEIQLYHEVTGLYPDVVTEPDIKRNVRAIQERHHVPRDEVKKIMAEKYALWCATRNTAGALYSPSKPGWLEWCISGHNPTPAPPTNGKRKNSLLPDGV